MKTKIFIIVIILLSLMIPVTASAKTEVYPKLTIICDSEKIGNQWIIYCVDNSQNVWTFYDKKGTWETGDIITVLMQTTDNNRKNDKILKVYYEGHTENIELWMEINGWQ